MFNARNLHRQHDIEELPYVFVFGVDGAIVNSPPHQLSAWQKILSENGIIQSAQEIEAHCFGKNEEIIQRFFAEQLSQGQIEEIAQRQEEIVRDLYRPNMRLIEGLKRFLDEAKTMNIQMAAISDSSLAWIDFVLAETGLQDYFKVTVGAEDVDRGEPCPDLLLKAALRLGMMPEDLIAFEGCERGLEAAERAGVKAFGIQPNPNKVSKTYSNQIQILPNYSSLRPTLAYAYSLKLSL